MKISYRTHPALRILKEDTSIMLDEKDSAFLNSFSNYFIKTLPGFIKCIDGSNIIRPSNEFVESAYKCARMLVFKEEAKELAGSSGCFLFKDRTTFFNIKLTESGNLMIEKAAFENTFNTLLYFVFSQNSFDGRANGFVSNVINFNNLPESLRSASGYLSYEDIIIMSILLFKKYAPVEFKDLRPHEKLHDQTCKYINDTDVQITYLDSLWFTTIVRSEGFDVRGHFRLQPKKKDGLWTKELIFINPFRKAGYTAPARKLNHTI